MTEKAFLSVLLDSPGPLSLRQEIGLFITTPTPFPKQYPWINCIRDVFLRVICCSRITKFIFCEKKYSKIEIQSVLVINFIFSNTSISKLSSSIFFNINTIPGFTNPISKQRYFSIMSKIVKQITAYLEEYLLNSTDLTFDEDKSNKAFLNYRLSLFRTVFFSIMYKKVTLLKNNLLTDPEIIKNTMVLFNNMVEEINSFLIETEFSTFNLELTKPEAIPMVIKKNPYRYLLKDLEEPMEIEESDYNSPCKPISGLFSFVIYHKTKTKTDLSINIISDSRSIKNEVQFKDVTGLIETKNHHIIKELEYLINTSLRYDLEHEFIPLLGIGKNYKEIEPDLYYGFVGTLVFNKIGRNDTNDILDMFYYPDKAYTPYFKLYYKIFQYKKETKKFIYRNVDDIKVDSFVSIIKQNDVLYSKSLEDKICLFYRDGLGYHIDSLDLKVNNLLEFSLNPNQKQLKQSDKGNKVLVSIIDNINNKKYTAHLGSKDILYNNISTNTRSFIFNKKNLLPSHILYSKEILLKNELFNAIQKEYILTNNEILRHKDSTYNNDKINLLFKICPTHMPWDKFILFLNPETMELYKTAEDVFMLLCKFIEHDEFNGRKIINTLLYTPLTNIFKDIYVDSYDVEDKLKKFQKFYEKFFYISDNCILETFETSENETEIIEENKKKYKDFLYILEVILLIIRDF